MQDDLLVFDSTVHETITFAAKLRLSEMTIRERTQREIDVMHLMDIHQFRNKLIGDYIDFPERAVTLSVRKRLCVAMELLTKPQFIFMDYPALGLTSSEAYSFCLSLKNLVVTGVCGVVCTLHNPSYHVYYSFDRVLLLQCGEMVYQGSVSNALISFTQCGLHVPNVSDEEETEAEFNYRTATLTEQTLRQLAGGDRQRLLDAQGIRRQQERNQPRTDADRVRRYWSKRYREMCDRVRKLSL
jgi:ABC-type multidrug transport system ATPase subunit